MTSGVVKRERRGLVSKKRANHPTNLLDSFQKRQPVSLCDARLLGGSAGGTRDTVWVRDIYKSRVWHMSYKKGAEGGRCFKWLPIPHHFFIKVPILRHWPLFILWGVVRELVSGDPSPKVVLLNNYFLSQTSFEQKTETARRGAIRCLLSPEIGQLWAEIASQMWPLMWGLGMLLLAPFNIQHHFIARITTGFPCFNNFLRFCHVWMLGHIEFWYSGF